MSCRTTSLTSAVISTVHMSAPGSKDAEAQSIFHSLKREGRALDAEAPTLEKYQQGLDKLFLHVRSNTIILDKKKEGIFKRLEAAREDEIPDGATWYAVTNFLASADPTTLKQRRLLLDLGSSMGWPWNRKVLEERFNEWCNPEADYEEVSSPDPRFQYEDDYLLTLNASPAVKRALRRLGYEHYLTQPYPVFVYGSLRAGEANHVIITQNGAVNEIIAARMPGVSLYDITYGSFPYAGEDSDSKHFSIGDLIWLNDDEFGQYTRADLDRLEGFHSDNPSGSHYKRVLKEVQFLKEDVPGGERQQAWVYLASGSYTARLEESTRIKSGDWFDISGFVEAYPDQRALDLETSALVFEEAEGVE